MPFGYGTFTYRPSALRTTNGLRMDAPNDTHTYGLFKPALGQPPVRPEPGFARRNLIQELQDMGGVVANISSIVVKPSAALSAPARRNGRIPGMPVVTYHLMADRH